MIIFPTVEQYNKRVEENSKIFKKQYKNNDFNITDYNWFDAKRKTIKVCAAKNKVDDIYAACILGFLPVSSPSGPDAYTCIDGIFVPVELKTTYINSKKIWQSDRGTAYTGKQNTETRRTSIKSSAEASFDIRNNLLVKDLVTYLILSDSFTGKVVDAYYVSGSVVLDYLTNNKNTNQEKTSSKRTIKLSTFMRLGTQAKTVVRKTGCDKWIEQVLKKAPMLEQNEIFLL